MGLGKQQQQNLIISVGFGGKKDLFQHKTQDLVIYWMSRVERKDYVIHDSQVSSDKGDPGLGYKFESLHQVNRALTP